VYLCPCGLKITRNIRKILILLNKTYSKSKIREDDEKKKESLKLK